MLLEKSADQRSRAPSRGEGGLTALLCSVCQFPGCKCLGSWSRIWDGMWATGPGGPASWTRGRRPSAALSPIQPHQILEGTGTQDFSCSFPPPGFWHGFQSQSEEYVGYSNMPAEISVHCEESKRLWQPPARTAPGVRARGKPAWAALDWLLPVCVFPSVKSSCEVTTKWMVGNNSKK